MTCVKYFIASNGEQFDDMEACNEYEKEILGGGIFCYGFDGKEIPLAEIFEANIIIAKSSFYFWKDLCPSEYYITEEEASSLTGDPGLYIWLPEANIYQYYSLETAKLLENSFKKAFIHLS